MGFLTHAGHVQHIREAKKHADLILLRLASAENAHTLYQLGVDKIALEAEDDKFLQKMMR